MQNKNNREFDLGGTKLILRFVDRDFSRYTMFVPLFKFSKSFLHLEKKFSDTLRLNYQPKKYLLPKIANSIVSLLCCGVDRFVRMDDELRMEKGLAKTLGFPKGFFTSRTAYRFFKYFNGYNINQLERINLEILKEQKSKWLKKNLFIDLDMNTKSVEGTKIEKTCLGYNRKRPGRLSLLWTVAHIAKVVLYSELDKGNASGKTVLKRQLDHIKKLLKKLDIKDQTIIWRVDGGYFSQDNLKFLNVKKFLIRIPYNLKIIKPFLEKKDQLNWKKYAKNTFYTGLGKVIFKKTNQEYRIVLIKLYRPKKKKKWEYYPICTNLFSWNAKSIVKAYRGRQIVENCFRDTNQAFFSNKLPSGSFYGNCAFLWFNVMAYNIFFFFQGSISDQRIANFNSKKTFQKIFVASR